MAPAVPPVLLLAWRRPETTVQVMEAIRDARPERLFIAVDGPSEHLRTGEADRVAETIRAIEQRIDWPCEVSRRYSAANRGCRVGVSDGIDWFFENVEEGIILEDDCVPHHEFFTYCADLLSRFRDIDRVMCISGDNSAQIPLPGAASYSFVRYPQVWGWATWRSAWRRYDRNLADYCQARRSGTWERLVPDAFERATFERTLDRLAAHGEPDTWDYQWAATLLLNRGLSVQPRSNLVRNIGFGDQATHTTGALHPRANAATTSILPLVHPRRTRLHKRVSREVFLRTQISQRKADAFRNQSPARSVLTTSLAFARRMFAPLR